MSDMYILDVDGKTPIRCDDLEQWGKSFANSNRIVAKTEIGNVRVSTVFLGLDHRCWGKGPPLVFETMIFGGEYDSYQERCSTYEQAQAMHAVAVGLVKDSLAKHSKLRVIRKHN